MGEEHIFSKVRVVARGAVVLFAVGGTVCKVEGDEFPTQAESPQYVYTNCIAAATTSSAAPTDSIRYSFNGVTE